MGGGLGFRKLAGERTPRGNRLVEFFLGDETLADLEQHLSRAGVERVLYGQRIDGVVRITDRPASGPGRSYLIETGLEQDGYAALKALVADYVRQAARLGAVPMASSVARQTLQLEAT